ncbi:MAG TPA: LPS assembly lipoprotein LptE [Planctomycetota bacterium]|nr:LPS assembly lipoprotein LptE [Planctomycetota bacterium]
MRACRACLLLPLLLAGCGYRARFELPPHLQTFAVSTFRNKTLERNLDFEFTEALIHEICARTGLRVARPGEADLEIEGEIEGFERHVLRRKRYGEKMEMRNLLYVNVEMRDTRKNAIFFQGHRIVERAEFSLNLGETPRDGRDELVRELARHVVALAFELWPHPSTEAKASGG